MRDVVVVFSPPTIRQVDINTVKAFFSGYGWGLALEFMEKNEHPSILDVQVFEPADKQISTPPKTNMDTQNDGWEKVAAFKYGHFWYVC